MRPAGTTPTVTAVYYYDGAQYTGQSDCSSVSSTSSTAAGWYGPYDDGCYYWWDGSQWTGDKDCTATSQTGSAAGWYGPYDDGCTYEWDGSNWTGAKSCVVNGTTYVYQTGSTSTTTQATTTTTTMGGQSVVFPDVTINVPANTGDCGDFCQTNIGDILVNQLNHHPMSPGDFGTLMQSGSQQAGTPGCEIVVEGYCYSIP